jgi:hypothetical protein
MDKSTPPPGMTTDKPSFDVGANDEVGKWVTNLCDGVYGEIVGYLLPEGASGHWYVVLRSEEGLYTIEHPDNIDNPLDYEDEVDV